MFQRRAIIYNQNKMICNNGYLQNIPINKSEKYYHTSKFNNVIIDNKPVINVLPNDCLEVAQRFIICGYNPVVLNMADVSFPGGGIEMGGYAQEESLFCRSNYFKTLNLQTGLYPITSAECIYSKDVFVFRDTNLNFLSSPFYVSFIACAAIKEPKLSNNCFTQNDYDMTFKKIELIFQIAFLKGHNCLILSAFGCGAYKNPKHQIVEIFNKCIDIYGHLFKFVIFAILPKDNMINKYICKQDNNCNYSFFSNNIQII